MTEFTKWVNGIKTLIEKRINKHPVTVWLFRNPKDYYILSIGIKFSNGMFFQCDFDQEEFKKNNYHQRHELAKIRRENMVEEMKDFCEDILQVVKSLS